MAGDAGCHRGVIEKAYGKMKAHDVVGHAVRRWRAEQGDDEEGAACWYCNSVVGG